MTPHSRTEYAFLHRNISAIILTLDFDRSHTAVAVERPSGSFQIQSFSVVSVAYYTHCRRQTTNAKTLCAVMTEFLKRERNTLSFAFIYCWGPTAVRGLRKAKFAKTCPINRVDEQVRVLDLILYVMNAVCYFLLLLFYFFLLFRIDLWVIASIVLLCSCTFIFASLGLIDRVL